MANKMSVLETIVREDLQANSVCSKTCMERILGELESIRTKIAEFESKLPQGDKDEPRFASKKTVNGKPIKPKSV